MRGKLHNRLDAIEAQVTRLASAAELHPTAEHIQGVHDEVKAARTDLKSVTATLAGVLAKASEAVAAPVKKTGAKAATPTSPGTPAADKENT